MLFSIIPFSHSLGTEWLLYFPGSIDPKDITIGSIIEIPYGNNDEYGIIAAIDTILPENISEEQYHRIRSCKRIITSKSILEKYQVSMIESLSKRYMIPIHRVLGMFLSKPILQRMEKKDYTILEDIRSEDLSQETDNAIHILQQDIVTPKYIEKLITNKTLIILPDDFSIIPYEEYFWKTESVFFFKNDLTDTKKAQAWIDIYNGKYSIIYWTRKILYYNLRAYTNIVYIEDALGADYWHYPIRIRYIDILHTFAMYKKNTNIQIVTSIPTISMLHHFKKFPIKNISHD